MSSEHPSSRTGRRTQVAINAPGVLSEPLVTDEALYEENITGIYAFIYSKVGHQATTQDLTADVFVKAFAHVDRTQSPMSIRSWLYHIARTTVADYWRATLRMRVIPLDELRDRLRESEVALDGDELPSPHELMTRARAVLNRLPPNYQQVLTLRFLQGYSLRETAHALGLSEGNVKVLQHRAIRKARDLLAAEEGDHGAR